MRYLWSSLLLLLLLLGPLVTSANAAPGKRPAGKKSSISSVRKMQKYNRKPNVYNAKRNRPLLARKSHWWQKR